MRIHDERLKGVAVAKKYGATKTVAIICNREKCYGDIFRTALAELGEERLVAALEHEKNSDWAWAAYMCLRDMLSNESRATLFALLHQKALWWAVVYHSYLPSDDRVALIKHMHWRDRDTAARVLRVSQLGQPQVYDALHNIVRMK